MAEQSPSPANPPNEPASRREPFDSQHNPGEPQPGLTQPQNSSKAADRTALPLGNTVPLYAGLLALIGSFLIAGTALTVSLWGRMADNYSHMSSYEARVAKLDDDVNVLKQQLAGANARAEVTRKKATADVYFAVGVEGLRRRDYLKAIELLEQAKDLDETDVRYRIALAEAYQGQTLDRKAKEEFEFVLRALDKNNVRALAGMGWSCAAMRDFAGAMQYFTKAEAEKPKGLDRAILNNNLAWAYLFNNKKDKHEEAVKLLSESIDILRKLDRQSGELGSVLRLPDCLNNRSWAYTELKEFDKTIRDAEEAIGLLPSFAWAHTSLGKAHMGQAQLFLAKGDIPAARNSLLAAQKAYEEAIRCDNGLDLAYKFRMDAQKQLAALTE